MTNRLGIDYLTLAGVAPDAFVRLAAEAGCGHLALTPALPEILQANGPACARLRRAASP